MLDACEAVAAEAGCGEFVAGINAARHDAYRQMIERGFRRWSRGSRCCGRARPRSIAHRSAKASHRRSAMTNKEIPRATQMPRCIFLV
jgi:hypothetical protein